MTGRLIAIVGPSGAGKDTLTAAACRARPDLIWVRRVITRAPDPDGEPFESVDRTEFERRRNVGDFAFWWDVHGLLYGIPAQIADDLTAGRTVIFNASRAALPEIRKEHPYLGVVAITAPGDILERRLVARGRETADEVRGRLTRADWPVPDEAITIVNDGSVDEGTAALLRALDGLTDVAHDGR